MGPLDKFDRPQVPALETGETFVNEPRLTFMNLQGCTIFTVFTDGHVELNPEFTVDECARAFWDAVFRLRPHGGA